MERSRARILLADDHSILTEALTAKLSEHFEVAGSFLNGRDLLNAMGERTADVIVMDISMPEMNGLEASRRIKAMHPDVRIVFLTMHTERPYVDEAIRAGATGYVLKRDALPHLVQAIESAVMGQQFVSPSASQPSEASRTGNGSALTSRQREIIQMVAEGKSAKEIAEVLGISAKTVEYHKAAIMDRLGMRTTAEVVRYAVENMMVGGSVPSAPSSGRERSL